ncbi:BMA-GLB-30, isoform a [Dirofilaria immitis]|nr:BMA-GLB-30, isoform a [Dirofilaria immitis]
MSEGLRGIHEDDKNLLRESWSIIYRSVEKIGLFPFTDTSKKDSDFIKFHALRFMQAIESVINSVGNLNEVDPLLTNLGHVHGKLKERLDFKPEYWSVFRECTLYHFRRALEKSNIVVKNRRIFARTESIHTNVDYLITLWGLLLDYMIEEMTASFRADIRMRELNKNNWLQNEDELINAQHLEERKAAMKMQRTEKSRAGNKEQNRRKNFCCGIQCFRFDQQYDHQ